VGRIARADPGPAPAVIAVDHERRPQPLLGCYRPAALALLTDPSLCDVKLTLPEIVGALAPRTLEVENPDLLFDVNYPDDLLQAAAMLDRRGTGARV
jgi:molybdopterin-guanine dinucleotide biosynthesis protein A